ncbi:PREDICTED: MARVEL domain-containing protein 3 [Crocodylus porosus]|uniref:MARVEL domain-containing protein 3 n=1 Tax=Crocodylus porosus TaxID=8502 RepID=UPI00093F2790|nr:PREDICTED: MARVEL domain-containing protein 3 [Crocodylus porosus]
MPEFRGARGTAEAKPCLPGAFLAFGAVSRAAFLPLPRSLLAQAAASEQPRLPAPATLPLSWTAGVRLAAVPSPTGLEVSAAPGSPRQAAIWAELPWAWSAFAGKRRWTVVARLEAANTLSHAACCQMVEAVLGLLILACSSVSYGSVGGYTGIPDLGSIYYYQYGGAYSGFSRPDGERARQLDAQFHRMKLPIARASMAVGGALMALALLLVLLGALRLPWRCPAWLLLECVLDVLLALGLLPALYFYFHQLQAVYASPLCQEREQLYQSKGYQGFSCSLHGADIAAGLFGCAAALVLALSAGLAVRGFRTVRRLQEKPAHAYEL